MANGKSAWANKLIFISLLLLLFSCRENKTSPKRIVNNAPFSKFENGDIICRHGNGILSTPFRGTSNKEKIYSHVGIILKDKDSLMVIHSEASEFTGIGGVKKEYIKVFLKNISTWGVYRIDTISSVRDSIAAVALEYVQKDIPFDFDFDYTTPDKLYCTELIATCINKAMGYSFIKPTGLFGKKIYYAVDDIYYSNKTSLIYKTRQ